MRFRILTRLNAHSSKPQASSPKWASTTLLTYFPRAAGTLERLGELYGSTGKLKEASEACEEALEIRRQMAKRDPIAYRPSLAEALYSLALLYVKAGKSVQAEGAYIESLGIFRDLAKNEVAQYLPHVAKTLNNLALLYLNRDLLEQAQKCSEEALEIRRHLWNAAPSDHANALAQTLIVQAHILKERKTPCEGVVALAEEAERVVFVHVGG